MTALALFQKELNRNCPRKFIESGKDYETLPISYVESMLDAFFLGQWSTTQFTWQVISNEVVGSLTLEVVYPFNGYRRTLTGAASTKIRQQAGSDITDPSSKLKNALEMDFPRLKAMCLKNAAKDLGNIFGRNLNRKLTSQPLEIVKTTLVLNQIMENNA